MIVHCEDEGNCEGVDLNRNFPSGWGLGYSEFVEDSKKPWKSVFKGIHRKKKNGNKLGLSCAKFIKLEVIVEVVVKVSS